MHIYSMYRASEPVVSEWIGMHAHSPTLRHACACVPCISPPYRGIGMLRCRERCPPCPAAWRSMCRCPACLAPSHATRPRRGACGRNPSSSSSRWPFARRAQGRDPGASVQKTSLHSLPVSGCPAPQQSKPHTTCCCVLVPSIYSLPRPVVLYTYSRCRLQSLSSLLVQLYKLKLFARSGNLSGD